MKERKSKNRGPLTSPLLVALVAVGILFLGYMGVKALTSKDPAKPVSNESMSAHTQAPAESHGQQTEAPADTQTPADSRNPVETKTPAETEAPVSTGSPVQTDSPAQTEAPVVTEPVTTTPPATEPPAQEAQMMQVDESYFSDALFIGDSRTDGLRLYSPIGDASYYCGTSMSIFKVMSSDYECCGYTGIRNLLQNKQFGKIYIMFGINECGYDTDYFANTFKEVVDEIRSYQPDAIIYLQSILYVTQNHENNSPVFSSANLKEKNATIKALANDKDIFYLEVNDCLNDGTDHLPSDYTGDGVHLKASYYYLWKDYLMAHAVVDAAHPWSPSGETSQP